MDSVAPNINANIPQDLPFYKILDLLEKKKGLTEREVIERLEIPRSTYRSWKDGTCEPSRRTQWQKLIQVFEINAEILIFGPKKDQKKRKDPYGNSQNSD